MDLVRLAWRNIWRNGKRTAITASAIALNTAILIVSYGLMLGLVEQMVRTATRMAVGDVQVHAQGFRSDRSLYKTIEHPAQILAAARDKGLAAAARAQGFGLVSSGIKSSGAIFWGVDPAAEREAFEMPTQLLQGSYLGEPARQEVVLGQKLARSLRAEVGCEIVAVVQAADGSLGNELFRVSGILKAISEDLDRTLAIVHRDDYATLFVAPGKIHEIAIWGRGALEPSEVVRRLDVAGAGEEMLTWQELQPQLAALVQVYDVAIWIFGLVFLLAAGLGVMNTMLMATFERIREFGILKAIGTTPWRIVRDVALEAWMLALVSTAVAVVLGGLGAWYLKIQGLDLSIFSSRSFSIAGLAFQTQWKGVLTVGVVLIPVVAMWLVCVLSSLYPAIKAARLDPVRAIHHV